MKRSRPGRPALDKDDPSVIVSVRMPSRQFDAYCQRARREEVSVPEIIRRDLAESEQAYRQFLTVHSLLPVKRLRGENKCSSLTR